MTEWRNFVCGAMIVIAPVSVMTQGSSGAMLHTEGETRLNGNVAPHSSAIFLHDLVQTPKGHSAKIDADGSTATVLPETIVRFEGDELVLDHGRLQLNTSRAMKVRVNCLIVIPLTQEWTRYDVNDVDGMVLVYAYEKDVTIQSKAAAGTSKRVGLVDVTVHQGEQVTRTEKCGNPARPAHAIDARGAILNSPLAIAFGALAVGAISCFAWCRPGEDPLSPYKP